MLERWITPSLFNGLMAQDEYSFCLELGEKKSELLDEHRRTFITEDDLTWIKSQGLNAVRIPVPYWVFGDEEPYLGCLNYLDWAFETCQKLNLKIILSLHTAPGSQNGNQHSGQKGPVKWHTKPENITRTVEAVRRLAERYGDQPGMIGLGLLNEPSSKIPKQVLLDYYQRARESAPRVPLIISDGFQPEIWSRELTDMTLDTHLYQVFSADDNKRPIHRVIKKAKYEWTDTLDAIKQKRPVIVGEWSTAWGRNAGRGLDDYERDLAKKAYADAQLATYKHADGWFYWNYKQEDGGSWSFRDAVQRGWISL